MPPAAALASLPAPDAFLRRQLLLAAVINGVLSLGFALVALHGRPAIPLWGAGGMAVDFAPQVFMVVLMTVFATTVATRKARAAGLATREGFGPPLPRPAIGRALLIAVVALCTAVPLTVGALALAGADAAPARAFVLGKVAYGMVLGMAAAILVVRAALGRAG